MTKNTKRDDREKNAELILEFCNSLTDDPFLIITSLGLSIVWMFHHVFDGKPKANKELAVTGFVKILKKSLDVNYTHTHETVQ